MKTRTGTDFSDDELLWLAVGTKKNVGQQHDGGVHDGAFD